MRSLPTVRLARRVVAMLSIPAALASAQEAPPANLGAQRLIVLPLQGSRAGAMMDWVSAAGGPRALAAAFDSAWAYVIAERRLDEAWVLPEALERSYRRNPTYATAPTAIRAGDAVRQLERNRKGTLAEPVASQLRVLVGLHDARHALVPVDVRLDAEPGGPAAGTRGKATLHVALVDVRAGQLVLAVDVAGDAQSSLRAALQQVAERAIDLLVPR